MTNEDGTPFLGTRYYFLLKTPLYNRPLLIVSTDIAAWLADPMSNGCDGTFDRLVGIARGEDGNWIWQSDDWDQIKEMVSNG